MKPQITGIGGIFFRTTDTNRTRAWYKEHLGLASESWGTSFPWRDYEHPDNPGSTTWGVFADESDYFGNSGQEFMINYRVNDLDALLESLERQGIFPVKSTETFDYGKFVWIDDVDGRRIELWEPKDDAFGL